MKEDLTRRLALSALIVSITAIAVAYASAFRASGPPTWAAWLLALGIPLSLGAIMILGAARGGKGGGVGSLKLPFAFVIVVLAAGFCAALLLPDRPAMREADRRSHDRCPRGAWPRGSGWRRTSPTPRR